MVFAVEDALTKLQSTNLLEKQVFLDELQNILPTTNLFSNLQIDVRLKFLNSIVATLQDANHKIVISGLGCIDIIIEKHFDHYQPLVNMSFDVLLLKLGDAKTSVRTRASTVVMRLIQSIGLTAGYEKLSKHISHKNFRIKEQILHCFLQLCDIYGDDMAALPALGSKLAPVLQDPNSATRQLATAVLSQLYAVMGEALIDEVLEATSGDPSMSLRPAQLDNIRRGADAGAKTLVPEQPTNSATSKSFYATDPPKGSSRPPPSRPTSLSTGRSAVGDVSLPPRGTMLSKQSSTGSDSVNSRTTLSSGASTPTFTSNGVGKYRPEAFMPLLGEGSVPKPFSVSLDISRTIAAITDQLGNEEDWQARTSALVSLHGLAVAVGGTAKVDSCIQQLRPITELIAKQIGDLRSSVSKEASRTVAALAKALSGPTFSVLAEVWIAALMKLVIVKTQVIQSAADRSIRILISSCAGGVAYHRFFSAVLDACEAKAPAMRALALEYTCIAVALQKLESHEKHGAQLKRCIRKSLSDADPSARKTARHLFCLLNASPLSQWRDMTTRLLADIDSSAAKHLQTEMSSPHPDLFDLLNLKSYFDAYEESPSFPNCGSDNDSISSGFQANSANVPDDSSVNSTGVKQSRVPKAFQRSRTPLGMRSTGAAATTNTEAPAPVRRPATRESEDEDVPATKFASRRMSTAPAADSDVGTGLLGTLGGSRRMSMGPMRVSRNVTTTATENIKTKYRSDDSAIDTSAFSTTPATAPLSDITTDEGFLADPVATGAAPRPASRSSRPMASGGNTTGMMGGAQRVVRPVRAEAPATPTSAVSSAASSTASIPSRKSLSSTTHARLDSSKTLKSSSRLVPTDDDTSVGGSSVASKECSSTAPKPLTHDEIKTLVSSAKWNDRCDGFQAIGSRLPHLLSVVNAEDTSSAQQRRHLDDYLDLSVSHLTDVHHKVVREAMLVVDMLISVRNPVMTAKLGIVIPALFQRLADKKPSGGMNANDLLDKCRTVYEAPVLMGALSPRLAEVPERLRVAILQFMISIAPYCEAYFASQSSTGPFLNRLAMILGASTSKPSTALMSAGKRLLFLVYKTSTQAVLNQVAALPLQQQNIMKNLLQDQVPNIDSLAATASRAQWNSTRSKLSSSKSEVGGKGINAAAECEVDKESSPVDSSPLISQQTISGFTVESLGNATPQYQQQIETRELQHTPATPKTSPAIAKSRPPTTPLQTPPPLPAAATSSPTRDITWIIWALRSDSDATREDKLDAIREVRRLSRSESQEYWATNCAQILSVLLELFTFTPIENTGTCRPYTVAPRAALAGFTPPGSRHVTAMGEENRQNNADDCSDPALGKMESMHFACKALQMLVKLQGYHVKNFMELLVSRLLKAASFAPVAVSLHCEQILTDASVLDPLRFVRLIIPYAIRGTCDVSNGAVVAEDGASVRLIALHTLASAVKNLNSTQLISVMDQIVPCVLPYFSSPLVDTRKAVVFVLVEVYMIVGDALRPYVASLSASQRKLLTVYIDRQMLSRGDRQLGHVNGVTL